MPRKKMRARSGGIGHDGRFEQGERLIDAPAEVIAGEYVRGDRRKVKVTVNVRESGIEHMASRGRLDATQVAIADRFRKCCELAAIGRLHSIDVINPGGGGGGGGDPITDDIVRAGRQLDAALERLGPVYSQILVSVVGEGTPIEALAKRWSQAGGIVSGRAAVGYISGTLVDALDALIRIWKAEAHGELRGRVTSFNVYRRDRSRFEPERVVVVNDVILGSGPMTYTGPANEILVDDKGRVSIHQKRGVDRCQVTAHVSGNLRRSAAKAPPHR
jgi:hypothetical protein